MAISATPILALEIRVLRILQVPNIHHTVVS
jgi:hypothetical protein